ncbi:hypothetical protein LOZ61_004389 [Ophidiomyces ophidiicola]|nr:hypothetical protein LOZ61_004389 [Ophidiomyces ophidiicola]KAI1914274.1 hypothetical protein LOZ64_003896 [Ophidiomyces ophidiicola]KAI1925658.1 hypothetical protein LOZ60_003979 [Ophidiomyces ophidiicola]KAI2011255.1 hypothetical protein LOZ49_003133 [Ophidiomyces ophidiicola]KAI2124008.1 hypothetical protein LOZ31_004367 [Ophidiomyces ophidiicola]
MIVLFLESVPSFEGTWIDSFHPAVNALLPRVWAQFQWTSRNRNWPHQIEVERTGSVHCLHYYHRFEYSPDPSLFRIFHKTAQSSTNLAQIKSSYTSFTAPDFQLHPHDAPFQTSQEIFACASCFTFNILTFVLKQLGDENVIPHVHVSLAFIWALSMVLEAMAQVQHKIPWAELVTLLNTLNTQGLHELRLKSENFPAPEDGSRCHLPEDFAMHGLVWSQLYYPAGFFEISNLAYEEERIMELPSVIMLRTERCLWLGHRLASLDVWISYDERTRKFLVNDVARDLGDHAKAPILFSEAKRYFGQRDAETLPPNEQAIADAIPVPEIQPDQTSDKA